MSKRLKVHPDVSSVTVEGVEYQAKNGVVVVHEAHEQALRQWHGLLSPEEHEAREREQARLAAEQAAAVQRQAQLENEQRVAAAKAFLEANGLAVMPAKK